MDRLEMVIELVQEAKREKKRLENYEKEYRNALQNDRAFNLGYRTRSEVDEKYHPLPKKSVVNDNLKMARRILLGEYMKGC